MPVPIDSLAAPAFPLHRGRAYFAMAEGADVIHQEVMQVLGTKLGTRVMNPTFGCEVHNYAFEPGDEVLQAMIDNAVRKALQVWVPRVDVVSVSIDSSSVPNKVLYTVRYRIRGIAAINAFTGDLPVG